MMEQQRSNPERRLKERFIVLRDYAHLMLLTEVEATGCVHDAVYSSTVKRCFNCDFKKECKCLIDKSTTSIMELDLRDAIKEMEIAKNYVGRKSSHNIQDDGSCDCDACSWLAEYHNTHTEAFEIIREVAL